MADTDLAYRILSAKPGATIKLDPPRKEFQGPIKIHQPLIIDGQSGTIWAERGPVVIIESPNVELRNLNIEITGNEGLLSDEEACALVVRGGHKPRLQQVAVRGNVLGLDAEEGGWRYPRSLRLNALRAGQAHTFTLRLVAPVPFRIESEISGVAVNPQKFAAGPGEVTLQIEPMSPGTRLRGILRVMTTDLIRRVEVSGQLLAGPNAGDLGYGQVIYQPVDWAEASVPVARPPQAQAPAPVPPPPPLPKPAPSPRVPQPAPVPVPETVAAPPDPELPDVISLPSPPQQPAQPALPRTRSRNRIDTNDLPGIFSPPAPVVEPAADPAATESPLWNSGDTSAKPDEPTSDPIDSPNKKKPRRPPDDLPSIFGG